MWDEITYPFPNFCWGLFLDNKFHHALHNGCDYLFMLELKLIHVSKMGPRCVRKYDCLFWLTHWGRVTHICIGKLTIIGSDNGLSPGRRQAIIWTNAGILLIRLLGTNFSEILIGIQAFSFKKMHLKMLSVKWLPFCLGLNVFIYGLQFLRMASFHCSWSSILM